MWDCQYRRTKDDSCKRRKAKCFPGGVACVLKDKLEFPLRVEADPLLKKKSLSKMSDRQRLLDFHVKKLRACRLCPKMIPPSVSGGAVVSQVLLVGQAPGDKEPKMGRPFAWTAGKTLFRWFMESTGVNEEQFRSRIYMAAVCRCFPGKKASGGDRVPAPDEIEECSRWIKAEVRILRPSLIIPVGKLAIAQFLPADNLENMIGHRFRTTYDGHEVDIIPLPHPSGASPWHRMEPGKTLLKKALNLIRDHEGFQGACSLRP